MHHNILITGASGYLGGSLLARLGDANLPPFNKLYALIRNPEQEEAVKKYGAEPLTINLKDEESIVNMIVDNAITIVYYLIGAMAAEYQIAIIKALAKVKKQTGHEVHLLHTTGAKVFSEHSGHPTDHVILDTDPNLYNIQKSSQTPLAVMQQALNTNNLIIDNAEKEGVRSYIFIPCIVYGKGEGFGNPVSIQTVAIVKAAKKLRRVYRVDSGRPVWPVCHIRDNSTLYVEILRQILLGENPGHGKNGYYMASSGSIAWDDIYSAMAKALAKREVVDDESVHDADDAALQNMGEALGCPKEFVPVSLGGKCMLQANHGKEIGWTPQFSAANILEAADAEVELILANL